MLDLKKLEVEVDNFIEKITGEDYENFFKNMKITDIDLHDLLKKYWEDKQFLGIFGGYYYSNSADPKDRDTIVLYGQDGQWRVQNYIKEREIL